jgi:outer membrane receptor protein involved in Fe transport
MERNSQVARAVRHALVMGATFATGATVPALAQDTADVDTVVVTGSRIKSANLTGTTPVTQVTAQDIETQGVVRVEDLVNELPQAFAAQNATQSNGASGAATIDLRGLGSPRTLVLVDGRRMPYGSVGNSAPDVNMVPTQMIERVEVLTGGASAVYGSDAVAGVVNFITKKDFTGLEFGAQYSFYQHENDFGGPGIIPLRDVIAGRAATNPAQFALPDDNVTDGFGWDLTALFGVGTEDGRGNMTAYLGYSDNDPVLQRDRDYSACAISDTTAAGVPRTSYACGGSATSYPGLFTDFSNFYYTVDSAGAGNTFRNYNGNTDAYNYAPTNYYLRPAERFNAGVSGHYEFNKNADVYTQVMYTDYESVAQIAPSGDFFETNVLNCGNPFLSAQQAGLIGCDAAAIAANTNVPLYIGRRNVEGGGRQSIFENNGFRAILGVRGDITENWQYDVSGQWSSTSTTQTIDNYFLQNRVRNALNVIPDPDPDSPTFGQPVCSSVVNGTDPACIPWNIFQLNQVTPEALAYLQAPSLQIGTLEQEVYLGTINGDLGVKLPTAVDTIQVVFGAEYRYDKIRNQPDSNFTSANLSGQAGATPPIAGSTHVTDLFTEIRLPLVQDKTGVEDLFVDAAYRYSDYGDVDTNTYKVGLEWAPVSDFRLRGSFQRAVRAANIVELFSSQFVSLFDADDDPCGPIALTPDGVASLEQCEATGVPTALYGAPSLTSPAGQYQVLVGGNPDLTPEESDTYTYGIIFTPRFLPGFSFTADYFDIKVENTISTLGPENTWEACYVNLDPQACSLIDRNPANGSLWVGSGNVIDLNVNIGSIQTSGIDFNVAYDALEMGKYGSLNFRLIATWLDELKTDPGAGFTPYECNGFYQAGCFAGGDGPNPEWRSNFRVAWELPKGWDLGVTWRYYGSVDRFGANPAVLDYTLGSQNFFDFFANWAVTEKASVLFGVNNFLDEDPPIAVVGTGVGNGNTYPGTYDAMGRYVFLRANIGF